MKFILAVLTASFLGSAWGADVFVCNVNLMKTTKGQIIFATQPIMETVAGKSFAHFHGAIMVASSPEVLFDETETPLDRRGRPVKNPPKEEVVISMGHIVRAVEKDASLTVLMVRESEKNKYGVRTKREELGKFEFKLAGDSLSEVVFFDKYALQVACNIVDKP